MEIEKREKREKEEQEEEDKIFKDTKDSFEIPETVVEKIRSSLSKIQFVRLSKYANADKILRTLLLKKCRPGTKKWWNTWQSLRNLENLNEYKVFSFCSE